MKSKIVLFILAFIVWCLLSWVPGWQHLIIGAAVALLVALLIGDVFVQRPHRLASPVKYLYFIFVYMPVFLWECFKANVDVAYRVSHPGLPIEPGIVKVKTKLKSDTGITFLANSITLTPGTLSVDVDKEDGVLYIHWICVKETDIDAATKKIVGRFEKILEKVFE